MKTSSHPSEFRKTLTLFILAAGLLLIAGTVFSPTPSASANFHSLHTEGRAVLAPVVPEVQGKPAAMVGQAIRTPRPTATPVTIPPPADPASSNLMIIIAGLIVLVILMGVWFNRRRV
jgi:hypothetical protein